MLKRSAPEVRGAHCSSSVVPTRFASRALIAAVAFASIAASPQVRADSQKRDFQNWQGRHVADFTLRDVDNNPLRLSSLRGKIVFLHFFATWCEPCREELPALNRLVERSQSRKISVVAISVAEVPDRVRRFLEKEGLTPTFPVLLDQDRAVTKNWGVQILPSTIVLDRKLAPRLVVASDYAWDNLDLDRLVARLSGPRTASTIRIGKS